MKNHNGKAVGQNERELRNAIADCHKYFEGLGLVKGAVAPPNPNIQDSDGLVTYLNASSNNPPADLMQEYREISAILEGLTGIVTAAVLQISGGDTKKQHLASTWNGPLDNIVKAFFGPYSDSQQSQNKQVIGLEIATEFLSILLAAAVTGGPALAGFQTFLKSQGETMRVEAGSSMVGYKYACVGMAHELFELQPGDWLYVPKLKYYFTEFSQENMKVSVGCASADKFKFAFEMRELSGAFKLEYWRQNQWFKDEVTNFIKKYTKANIEESTNYFDGIFASNPSAATTTDLRLTSLENRAVQASASL